MGAARVFTVTQRVGRQLDAELDPDARRPALRIDMGRPGFMSARRLWRGGGRLIEARTSSGETPAR